jgi:hypothetical protein
MSGAIDEKKAVMIFFAERYTIDSSLDASLRPMLTRDKLIPEVATPVKICMSTSNVRFAAKVVYMPTKHQARIQIIYKGAAMAMIVLLLYRSENRPHKPTAKMLQSWLIIVSTMI